MNVVGESVRTLENFELMARCRYPLAFFTSVVAAPLTIPVRRDRLLSPSPLQTSAPSNPRL
jgi:hypothetical protein